jgi:arachidonate 5-lipoxygenase
LNLLFRCASFVIQAWIGEIHAVGFAQFPPEGLNGLPTSMTSIDQLANLATRLIFTSTCQHSATHTEALDLYGFVPGVPAMMRQPPMTRRRAVTKDSIARTLPDQFPDAYYGSLATVLQIHRPEEVSFVHRCFLCLRLRE